MQVKLLKHLSNLIANNPIFNELELTEILQSFSRGSFGTIFSDAEVKKFGGAENLKNLSLEILNSDKILHNNNKKNYGKNPK